MENNPEKIAPRTTADLVFETLHEEILSLKLLPGTKISEADVANRLGVSRQPARDAFNRLANLDLLSIRPQRATIVRQFSLEQINNARFVRMAVELEVMARACEVWEDESASILDKNIAEQRAAIDKGQINQFHALDYHFHKTICELGGHPLAFETVARCKQQVDRLCVLSLARENEVSAVLADHEEIAQALKNRDETKLLSIVRRHLSRLDGAIEEIYAAHSEYFS